MILVDTSVWVDHLRGGSTSLPLVDLLHQKNVVSHSWIFGELMMGSLSPSRRAVLASLGTLPEIGIYPVAELYEFVEKENLDGQGLSLIDLQLLYASIVTDSPLWTLDRALRRAAEKYGTNHVAR